MSRFFVLFFCCLALSASAAKKQKLRQVAEHEPQPQPTHQLDAVHIEFEGDYSPHSAKKYSSSSELTSLAHSSAIQAKTAVKNQQTASIQAALGAQTGYARAALEAASTAQVALVAKQLIVQSLQQQLHDAEHQVSSESSQYQQTLQAAHAAQTSAEQAQQQLTATGAALTAVQVSVQVAEKAAAQTSTAAASQHDMIQKAKQRVAQISEKLHNALAELHETESSAQKASAAAQIAQGNAAAAAQLVVVSQQSQQHDEVEHSSGNEYHH